MTFVAEDLDPSGLERKSPTEAADIDEIRRGMLAIQAQAAAAGQRPLARGTHAKGICVKAEFEVLDVRQVARDPALADRLARGIFSSPASTRRSCDSRMPMAAIDATACPTSAPCRSRSTCRPASSLAPPASISR